MVCALVLVIQVVGMFPHIDCQQWLQALRERSVRVAGCHDLELGALEHQPGPPASELGDSMIGQFFLAGVHAAKCCFHFMLQDRGWFTAAFGLETMPVEIVIPRLRRIVKDALVVRLADSRGHDLIEWQIGELSAHDQLVRGLNICPVMPVMVKAQRFAGN